MPDARTLLPLASALLLAACGDGGQAAPKEEDMPQPAQAVQGVDQGLPNPDAAQPPSETSPPRPPAAPPVTTETKVDDAPPEQVIRPDPVVTPADPANPGGLPPGESVDAPPSEETDEPTEPMA